MLLSPQFFLQIKLWTLCSRFWTLQFWGRPSRCFCMRALGLMMAFFEAIQHAQMQANSIAYFGCVGQKGTVSVFTGSPDTQDQVLSGLVAQKSVPWNKGKPPFHRSRGFPKVLIWQAGEESYTLYQNRWHGRLRKLVYKSTYWSSTQFGCSFSRGPLNCKVIWSGFSQTVLQ